MKFHDKFKPGDIICSDRFHNGLCMVVSSLKLYIRYNEGMYYYECDDLVKENQGWDNEEK